MAGIDPCLKKTFTIFNVFFAIIGAIIIALTLLCQILTSANGDELEGRTYSIIALYVMGVITMSIAILGACGAHKESKVCLIVFLICMVIGSLLMLRTGVPIAVARPRLEGLMEEKFRQLLPLDKASEDVKDMADSLQTHLQCCGLFSYQDWERNIPDSCHCNEEEEMEGLCQTESMYKVLMQQKSSIFSRPCFPIMMHYVLMIVDIMIGVVFSLAVLALLGMILSSIMIHQMRYRASPTMVVVPAVFTCGPPKYQELHNQKS
ncbi:tetraspanin-8-like [Scomber japonicus]|uniref:tetraspanin-8-like n=1 Tax=Scomber japonicus TaxID=13676 RepID=UPI002306C46D|nr:tetraspanin-8-like [Scomber japonicus]